jgi:hypothetical protein
MNRLSFATASVVGSTSQLIELTATMGPAYALASVVTPLLSNLVVSARKAMRMSLARRLVATISLIALLAGPALAESARAHVARDSGHLHLVRRSAGPRGAYGQSIVVARQASPSRSPVIK